MIATLTRLLSSRKAVAALGAGLAVVMAQIAGLDAHQADIVSQAIVVLACAYVGATGYEDAGRAASGQDPKPPQDPG